MVKSLYLLKNYQKFGGMSIKAMKPRAQQEKERREGGMRMRKGPIRLLKQRWRLSPGS
jgi:hypothetical protein